MPQTNSARLDLYNALLAIYTADSNHLGSSGSGSVDKGVRDFLMEGVDLANTVPPYIFVELTEDSLQTLASDHAAFNVGLHVFTEPDRSVSEQEVIAERVRASYANATLTGTDWSWSMAVQEGVDYTSEIGGTPALRHLVVRFRVYGVRGSSVSKPLVGMQAYVSFSPGSGGDTFASADCEYFETDNGVALDTFRYYGDRWEYSGPAHSSGRFDLVVRVRDAAQSSPSIPIGVAGTLTIARNSASSSNGAITGSAIMSRRRLVASAANVQTYRYSGSWSGPWTEAAS